MRSSQALLALAALLACAAPSSAVLVTYQFSGQFDSVGDANGVFGVTAGDAFTGSFTYDTSMTVWNSSPDNVVYEKTAPIAPLSFTAVVNGVTYSVDAASVPLRLQVTNNAGGLYDQFVLVPDGGIAHPLSATYPLGSMALTLRDTSNTVFTSTAIPASLSLGDFDVAQFNMSFATDPMGDPGEMDNVIMLGTITSMSAVPEVGAATLLALPSTALAVLAARRRRRA